MIRIKDQNQGVLFDPWHFLSPKRRDLLNQSWAGLFQKELLCELPVAEVAASFKEDRGRPTKELYTVLGVLLLQQAHDLTDDETVNQLAFNIQWHYALNITDESDSSKYMCHKILWTMRQIVTEKSLDTIVFDRFTDKLAELFNSNIDNQRIDSVHIKSNMRRLGRICIFTSTIHKFLINLKRNHNELFDSIDTDITDKYLSEKSLQCFSMVKPSESSKTLASVSLDLFDLVEQFKNISEIQSMHSFKLLERVLNEQCNVSDDGKQVEVKKPKEIPSDSLQNPSDPDATYSGHKGQGYQVQVMETYCKDGESDNSLNLITHVEVEPSHESDANALLPAIESAKQRNVSPEELLADSLYGSDENCQKAAELEVQVIAPTMGSIKKEDHINLSDFESTENNIVTSCPEGHAPVQTKTNKAGTRHTATFNSQLCTVCPMQEKCPVKEGKKNHYLRYKSKEMRLAKRRSYEQTDEFKDRYRWRAGVEAAMSEFDRKTGVKHLRVRGFKAVRFCATLKATAINLFRATAVQKAIKRAKGPQTGGASARIHAILVFKEHFFFFRTRLKRVLFVFRRHYEHMLIMAT
jgi:hypothetical protein